MACRSLTVTATPPSGAAQTLLFIPDFNPDWAEPLREAAPVRLPAGTRLALRAEYDNSRQNPRNAEGPLMPLRAAPGCADESAGTEIVLLARTPADATRLEAAVRSRPAGSLAVDPQRRGRARLTSRPAAAEKRFGTTCIIQNSRAIMSSRPSLNYPRPCSNPFLPEN